MDLLLNPLISVSRCINCIAYSAHVSQRVMLLVKDVYLDSTFSNVTMGKFNKIDTDKKQGRMDNFLPKASASVPKRPASPAPPASPSSLSSKRAKVSESDVSTQYRQSGGALSEISVNVFQRGHSSKDGAPGQPGKRPVHAEAEDEDAVLLQELADFAASNADDASKSPNA